MKPYYNIVHKVFQTFEKVQNFEKVETVFVHLAAASGHLCPKGLRPRLDHTRQHFTTIAFRLLNIQRISQSHMIYLAEFKAGLHGIFSFLKAGLCHIFSWVVTQRFQKYIAIQINYMSQTNRSVKLWKRSCQIEIVIERCEDYSNITFTVTTDMKVIDSLLMQSQQSYYPHI